MALSNLLQSRELNAKCILFTHPASCYLIVSMLCNVGEKNYNNRKNLTFALLNLFASISLIKFKPDSLILPVKLIYSPSGSQILLHNLEEEMRWEIGGDKRKNCISMQNLEKRWIFIKHRRKENVCTYFICIHSPYFFPFSLTVCSGNGGKSFNQLHFMQWNEIGLAEWMKQPANPTTLLILQCMYVHNII